MLLKQLIKLAIPIVIANILHTAYQITDTFWVGRLGANAVASVSLGFPIIFLLISLGGGMAVAGTILVAQYKGKKDYKNLNFMAGQTFFMMFVVAIILTIVGYFLSPVIVNLMTSDPLIAPDAIAYLRITFMGLIFPFIFYVFQSLMRGVGDVKIPMLIVLGTVILNLFLDPLFIINYNLGVSGAAIATIITEALAALIGILILFNGKYGIRLKFSDIKPNFNIVKKIFKLGLPSSMDQTTRSLAMTVMIFIVTGFGTAVTAAYGIGGRILSFIIIPAFGISMATSTLVGQNMGRKDIKKAKEVARLGMILGFLFLQTLAILIFIFAVPLATFFVPGETEVIAIAANFIRVMSFTMGFAGIHIVMVGTLVGAGDTVAPMILTIISLWVFRIPLAYFLSKTNLSYEGIWWAFPIANVLGLLVAYIWYRRGTWQKKEITKHISISE
jgi:putative MATE family efflux protein